MWAEQKRERERPQLKSITKPLCCCWRTIEEEEEEPRCVLLLTLLLTLISKWISVCGVEVKRHLPTIKVTNRRRRRRGTNELPSTFDWILLRNRKQTNKWASVFSWNQNQRKRRRRRMEECSAPHQKGNYEHKQISLNRGHINHNRNKRCDDFELRISSAGSTIWTPSSSSSFSSPLVLVLFRAVVVILLLSELLPRIIFFWFLLIASSDLVCCRPSSPASPSSSDTGRE